MEVRFRNLLSLLFMAATFSHNLYSFTCLAKIPSEIQRDMDSLVVNRQGNHPQAYMLTKSIVGVVQPQTCYQLKHDGLSEASCTNHVNHNAAPSMPAHIKVNAEWINGSSDPMSDANILGGFGSFISDHDVVQIPVSIATLDALSFYGAQLLQHGDVFRFESDSVLGIFDMQIGDTYVSNYLMNESFGHGAYLEFHDRPHFHMPINRNAGGALILGKRIGDNYYLSAFSIPHGFAIYTPPNVIHADSHLVGEYLVVYSVTETFSTTLVKNKQGELVPLVLSKVSCNPKADQL